jgi:hypothetical protein
MFANTEARAMNKKFHLLATMALCGAWLWALVSGPVAADPRVGVPILLVLCAVTLMAVRHIHVRRIGLGTAGMVLCAITLALMIFTFWGRLLDSLVMPTLPESLPLGVRLSPLFFMGPFVAGVTALLFAYPLAVLLPRAHWLVPVLAAACVGWLQYEEIVDPAGRPLTRTLMTVELASLAILVPVVVGVVVRRMRGKAGVTAVAG